jgi:hypothetical protein
MSEKTKQQAYREHIVTSARNYKLVYGTIGVFFPMEGEAFSMILKGHVPIVFRFPILNKSISACFSDNKAKVEMNYLEYECIMYESSKVAIYVEVIK